MGLGLRSMRFGLLFSVLYLAAGPLFAQQLRVSYAPSAFDSAFTGHVVVYLSKDKKEPRTAEIGFELIPCFSLAVANVKPGTPVTIDDKATSYPAPLSDIERGEYYIQIVWDRNLGGRSIAMSPGNIYSKTQKIDITRDRGKVYNIVATEVNPEPVFKETQYVKELKVPSQLLSSFRKRNTTIDATVILPKEYEQEPERKFPVLFEVSGYGGDHGRYSGSEKPSPAMDSVPVIKVLLDGKCSLGHSVYANSDNNGPWGDALTTEFIPALEKKFRTNGARLLWGHSSGGWTVLWLQTHYPKVFIGCWSSSPDPMDFRSFQKIDLYEDKNMYYAADSSMHYVATVAGFFPWVTQKDIYRMEHVVYRGEQMHSFNAVFSAKGPSGDPEEICESSTGVIDHHVFEHWKQYDISAYLASNWASLKLDLNGKIRVSVGKQDNFLLNYAVMLLEERMKTLDAAMKFAYYPGDHFTLATPEYMKDGYSFLKQKYNDWLAEH